MKKSRIFSLVVVIMMSVMVVAACGKKSVAEFTSESSFEGNGVAMDTDTMNAATEDAMAPDVEVSRMEDSGTKEKEESLSNSSVVTYNGDATETNDKIIRTFYLEVETQEFDSLITTINSEKDRLKGYIESSEISGKHYNYSEENRYASIVVRIPRNKVDEFVLSVDDKANVVNSQESSEDVTLQYTDIESRKKALEIEQERLFDILEKADNLENIITLESRLSDIRYELQNYETQLRTYDNEVEYSTVNLSINEVERMSPTQEEKKTVGERIKYGFSDTIYSISEGLKNFLVWFVVNLPYLLIWAAIITGIIIIIKKVTKKRKIKEVLSSPKVPQDRTLPRDDNH